MEGTVDSNFLRGLSNKDTILWCMSMKLITSEYLCPNCRRPMRLLERKDIGDGYKWTCRVEGDNKHHLTRSLRKGSWFEGSRLGLKDILLLSYMWLQKTPASMMDREIVASWMTLFSWTKQCRDICAQWLKQVNWMIGGPGTVVEFKEILMTRRDEFGHRIPGRHVLVGMECGTTKCFLTEVNREDTKSLRKAIEKYVIPESTLVSLCWEDFRRLWPEELDRMQNENVYRFELSRKMKGRNKLWKVIQEHFCGTRQSEEIFDSYLAECTWRVLHHGEGPEILFLSFLETISEVFPPVTEDPDTSVADESEPAAETKEGENEADED